MILSLGLDRQTILESISKDPLLLKTFKQDGEVNENDNCSNVHNLNDLIKENTALLTQDNQFTTELDDLNKLKTFRDLIMEFNANLELSEFENCYYSLRTLRNKINSYNTTLSRQSYSFQRSFMKYINLMHLRLLEGIHKLLFEKFWVIDNKDCKFIIFNSEISIDSEKFEYDTFISTINQLFFVNRPENEWFLKDMGICSESEEVRKWLIEIDSTFIKCNNIINLIKQNIFDSNVKFEYDARTSDEIGNGNRLNFIRMTTTESDKINIETVIDSIKSLIDFLQVLKESQHNTTIIKTISEIIIKELIKFVKSNARSILFGNSNNVNINDIRSICDNLVNLVVNIPNFEFKGSEIISLLEDKDLYNRILIDQNFNESIDIFKKLLETNKDWMKNKEVVQVDSLNDSKTEIEDTQDKPIEPINELNADDIEDAWNDEIDVSLDDLDEVSMEQPIKEEKEEDQDAWDAEWDIGNEVEDDIGFKNKDEGTIKVTKINQFIVECIRSFEQKCHEFTTNIQNDYYSQKLQMLQNTIFIMIQSSYPDNEWWQLHIDCKYTYMKDPKLTYISSIADTFLRTILIKHKIHIRGTLNNQLNELQRHEENPSWSPLIDDLLPYTKRQLLEPLSNLKPFYNEYQNITLDLIDYIYNKSIIDIISRWDIISAKNSDNLSELMSLIYNNIYIDSLERKLQTLSPNSNPTPYLIKYKEIREKFLLISKFLPLHLKDIMEMFYNGDFYLFDTEEIVSWITLLFADTQLRKDAITDIYEIRAAANED